MRARRRGQQQYLLVIAHQPVDAEDAVTGLGPERERPDAVWAAVDHVAQIDEPAPGRSGLATEAVDGPGERGQLVGTAMHVAHGEHALVPKLDRRRLPGR